VTVVVVHPDAATLAHDIAARMVAKLVAIQAGGGIPSVVLTGGTIAANAYEAVRESADRDTVDWSRVELWWGDERFLPSGDPDRNETQVREALLDAVPLAPERVHPMPASDGPDGDDPDAAAAGYAALLDQPLPQFDLVLLGIGPDGHVASLFPGFANLDDDRPASAVRDSPKPPPVRITLSFGVLNSADEVWVLASGAEKAKAVGAALGGAGRHEIPAAGVHGTRATKWLLDQDAASALAIHGD